MALTPEDVVNKRFQPTKFREGYDQDEVDDFLDEVVVELRRLNQENEELRQRLIAGESRINELQRSATQAPSFPDAAQQPRFGDVSQPQYGAAALVATPPVLAPPVAAPPTYPMASEQNSIDSGSTNNLLQLARKLHEEHVREGIEKRDALIAEGHATAARLVSEAEAAQRVQISTFEQERSSLESRIEELRIFEREYRQKLKGYIESQLRELDSSESPSGNVPSGNVPASNVAAGNVAASDAAPISAYDSVPAQNDSYDSGPTPPRASFKGFGGN